VQPQGEGSTPVGRKGTIKPLLKKTPQTTRGKVSASKKKSSEKTIEVSAGVLVKRKTRKIRKK